MSSIILSQPGVAHPSAIVGAKAFYWSNAPGFDPLTLAPYAWFSDTGASAATWPDISGNGRDATQATGSLQPAIIAGGQNGRQTRRADGTDDFLATASLTIPGDFSIYLACRCPWTTAAYRTFMACGYDGSLGIGVLTTGSALNDWLTKSILAVGDGANTGRAPRAIGPYGAGLIDNQFVIISAHLGAGIAEARINGANIATTVATVGAVPSVGAPLILFKNVNFGDFCNGDIGDAMIAPLSTALQKTGMETFLMQKWGVS